MSQSKKDSALESLCNLAVGMVISTFLTSYIFDITMSKSLSFTLLYTGISFVRSYTIRRIFERKKDESSI